MASTLTVEKEKYKNRIAAELSEMEKKKINFGENPEPYFEQANLYSKLGNISEKWEKNENEKSINYQLAIQKYTQAITNLDLEKKQTKESIKKQILFEKLRTARAKVYYRTGNYQEAWEDVLAIIDNYPNATVNFLQEDTWQIMNATYTAIKNQEKNQQNFNIGNEKNIYQYYQTALQLVKAERSKLNWWAWLLCLLQGIIPAILLAIPFFLVGLLFILGLAPLTGPLALPLLIIGAVFIGFGGAFLVGSFILNTVIGKAEFDQAYFANSKDSIATRIARFINVHIPILDSLNQSISSLAGAIGLISPPIVPLPGLNVSPATGFWMSLSSFGLFGTGGLFVAGGAQKIKTPLDKLTEKCKKLNETENQLELNILNIESFSDNIKDEDLQENNNKNKKTITKFKINKKEKNNFIEEIKITEKEEEKESKNKQINKQNTSQNIPTQEIKKIISIIHFPIKTTLNIKWQKIISEKNKKWLSRANWIEIVFSFIHAVSAGIIPALGIIAIGLTIAALIASGATVLGITTAGIGWLAIAIPIILAIVTIVAAIGIGLYLSSKVWQENKKSISDKIKNYNIERRQLNKIVANFQNTFSSTAKEEKAEKENDLAKMIKNKIKQFELSITTIKNNNAYKEEQKQDKYFSLHQQFLKDIEIMLIAEKKVKTAREIRIKQAIKSKSQNKTGISSTFILILLGIILTLVTPLIAITVSPLIVTGVAVGVGIIFGAGVGLAYLISRIPGMMRDYQLKKENEIAIKFIREFAHEKTINIIRTTLTKENQTNQPQLMVNLQQNFLPLIVNQDNTKQNQNISNNLNTDQNLNLNSNQLQQNNLQLNLNEEEIKQLNNPNNY